MGKVEGGNSQAQLCSHCNTMMLPAEVTTELKNIIGNDKIEVVVQDQKGWDMRFSNVFLGEDECKGLKSIRVGEGGIIQGIREKRGKCQQGWRNF